MLGINGEQKKNKIKELCDIKDSIMKSKLKFKIPLNRILEVSRHI